MGTSSKFGCWGFTAWDGAELSRNEARQTQDGSWASNSHPLTISFTEVERVTTLTHAGGGIKVAPRSPHCHRRNQSTQVPNTNATHTQPLPLPSLSLSASDTQTDTQTDRQTGPHAEMVSVRKRKLRELCTGQSSFLAPLYGIGDNDAPENPDEISKAIKWSQIPPAPFKQAVEVAKDRQIVAGPPREEQKVFDQIDPENPLEVHAYLMRLKEDNKLELGRMPRSEEVPVKEWMEECYPYIFRVFPQEPKICCQFSDKSKQNEFLCCHYWLFLYELRNIVQIGNHVSPEYVESLVNVIKGLEKQGFDCRFMRSEFVVVENMMKQQHGISLELKNVIMRRMAYLEKAVMPASAAEKKEAEVIHRRMERGGLEEEDLNESTEHPFVALEQECMGAVLECHKKKLAEKEEEGKRIHQVLEKINHLRPS